MGRVRIQTRTNPGAVSAIRDFILGLDYAQLTALLFLLGIGLVFIHSTGLQVDTPLSRRYCGAGTRISIPLRKNWA